MTGVRWDAVHTRLAWLAMDCAPPNARVPPAAAGCARLVDLLDVMHGLLCAARGCRVNDTVLALETRDVLSGECTVAPLPLSGQSGVDATSTALDCAVVLGSVHTHA